MTGKSIVLREVAALDIDEILEHYIEEGGPPLALDFVDETEAAFRHLAAHPSSGSPRYAFELDLPDLRCWPLKRFPYLIFYVEREDRVDVWRVLHAQRDIPAWVHSPR